MSVRQITNLSKKGRAFLAETKRAVLLDLINARNGNVTAPRLEKVRGAEQTKIKWRENFDLDYVLENCSFIHVGKCGGTSICRSFFESKIGIREYHLKKPPLDESQMYFICIRDPTKRFVSAFNHAKEILNFDTSSIHPAKLTLNNCPAPAKIRNRIRRGFAFEPEYDHLVSQFPTANDLAESLTSSNPNTAAAAIRLMRHPTEHIFKSIGWYLDNGAWVEKFHQNLLFVGCVENMESSFNSLLERLNISNDPPVKLVTSRVGEMSLSKELTSVGKANIKAFYRDTDYAAIRVMHKFGLIDDQMMKFYLN